MRIFVKKVTVTLFFYDVRAVEDSSTDQGPQG